MMMDDPVVHLAPPSLDWDQVVEVAGLDLRFVFPAKVHPKE